MSSVIVPDPAALLTVRQVATLLGCSARHVYRLSDRNAMPRPIKLGDVLVRWNASEIRAWISDGCRPIRTASGKAVRV